MIRKTRSQSVVVHLVDRGEVVHDAGDVRQRVDASAGGSDDGGHGLLGGDVAGHRDQVQPGVLGHEVIQAFLADVGGDDAAAFLGDAQGGGLADAGGGAGDDDGLAGEPAGGGGFLPCSFVAHDVLPDVADGDAAQLMTLCVIM